MLEKITSHERQETDAKPIPRPKGIQWDMIDGEELELIHHSNWA